MRLNRLQQVMKKTALLGVLLLLGACASLATGQNHSASLMRGPAEPLKIKAPKDSVLVVIRYPAVVDMAARNAYQQAYAASPVGGAISRDFLGSPDSTAIADSFIVKSNYFALSLYQELVKRLPENTVLLSPHLVKLTKDSTLTSEPITKAEVPGSVITIDFATYSFPDPEKMMGGAPQTFGDLVTPLVVVRTDHRAAPATDGLLLASQPLLDYAAGQAENDTERAMTSLEAGRLNPPPPAHAFIAYLAGGDKDTPAKGPLTRGLDKNAVQVYPLEKIRFGTEQMKALETDSSGTVDPLADVFSAPFADRIVAMLNDVDVGKALMTGKAEAVAQFDPSLAALTLAGSNDADYQARLRYAERLLEAERKYLSIQSLRIYDGVRNGEMGAQVRDMIRAENDVLKERRSLARKQMAATALAILGVVAASAIQSGNHSNSYGNAILGNAVFGAAIYAGTQVFAYKRQSKAVGGNYFAAIAPAIEEQTSVQVNLIDSSETITAIRFEDLQAKLQDLYNNSQRSLDTIATRCMYLDPAAADAKGAWSGVCKDGLAAGQGVGVLRLANGMTQEYFGTAKDGRPNGAGYMISHTGAGSSAIEGRFVNGQPDGIVRVSRPGKRDVLRLYHAGEDAGAAPRGASVGAPAPPAKVSALPVPASKTNRSFAKGA